MTSIIRVTPLSGALDESPRCYLLQIDDFGILLDCGWDENFNMHFIDIVKKHLHLIDAVLLSYPDPFHLGALPYLVGKVGLECPIYATYPVYKMGQMFMYDVYQSRKNSEDFDVFTLDDVDAAFEKIQNLKYSQSITMKGKGHGIVITPLPAGHMLGGTLWKIVKDGEEEVIYMVDYNHKKERHLNGCNLDSIGRPHLLITDTYNAEYNHERRKARDGKLMEIIVRSMRTDGNVLICVDTAGRVLELAQLLDQMWRNQESGLMTYSLALINNVSYNTVQFAKSQVEWMSDKITRAFEERRNNPFQFRHVQLCHNLMDLSKVPDPKVVLASGPDLECGYSRDLFIQWCTNPRNTIVLTNRTSPGTLARYLINNQGEKNKTISLQVRQRVRLVGKNLEEYTQQKRAEKKEEEKLKAEQIKRDNADFESSSESEAEDENDFALGNAKHDLMIRSESKSKAGFFKQAKKAYLMFPAVEDKCKWDEYGETVRPEDFMIVDNPAIEEAKMEVDTKEDPDTPVSEETPTQCISTKETFEIQAAVTFIDFEGRSDGDSIKKMVTQQIKPRMVVLIGGAPSPTYFMAEGCREGGVAHVFTPRILQVTDATTEAHIFQVKLLDSVVSSLSFARANEYELAWIEAVLDQAPAPEKIKSENSDDEEDDDLFTPLPQLPILTPKAEASCTGHTAVYINEPRLQNFKMVLQKKGILAEFSGGALICNNIVAVRRNEAGRLVLEGCLSEDYYIVRDLLYAQYAIV